jgi:hypothetical protein
MNATYWLYTLSNVYVRVGFALPPFVFVVTSTLLSDAHVTTVAEPLRFSSDDSGRERTTTLTFAADDDDDADGAIVIRLRRLRACS